MSGSILDLVQRLKAAGATAEMIADVLDTFAERLNSPTAAAEPARSKRQERNARYYDARKERLNASEKRLNKTVSDGNAPARAHGEPQPNTQETSYPKTPLKGGKKGKVPAVEKPSDRQQVLAAFDGVLSPDRAAAVIDHRTKLRKPMTAHAAHLLAGKFALVSNPNDAADAMIANGWQGFEPDWMSRQQRGPPLQGKPSNADLMQHFAEELRAKHEPADHRDEKGRPGHGFRGSPVAGAPLFERPGLEREHAGPTLDLVATRSDGH